MPIFISYIIYTNSNNHSNRHNYIYCNLFKPQQSTFCTKLVACGIVDQLVGFINSSFLLHKIKIAFFRVSSSCGFVLFGKRINFLRHYNVKKTTIKLCVNCICIAILWDFDFLGESFPFRFVDGAFSGNPNDSPIVDMNLQLILFESCRS